MKYKNNKKKAQSLSTDVFVVVILVFIAVIFLLSTHVGDKKHTLSISKERINKASDASKNIVEELKTQDVLTPSDELQFDNIETIDVEKLREKLNIKEDIAIVFERDGKLIKIDPEKNINCIGTSKVMANGVPCVMSSVD